MKKKDYFLVRPSAFTRYDNINIDGKYTYAQCENFDVEDIENFLIFEVKYHDCANGRYYLGKCKEKITGEVFTLLFQSVLNKRTGRIESFVTFVSDNLGLRSISLPLNNIWVEPSRVSGLLCHFKEDSDAKYNYCSQLKTMFEEARDGKWMYDSTVKGPSRLLTGEMKRTYRKSQRLYYDE